MKAINKLRSILKISLLFLTFQVSARTEFVKVSVSYNKLQPTDTLCLMYFPTRLDNVASYNAKYEIADVVAKIDGKLTFKFPITDISGHFFISKKVSRDLNVNKGNSLTAFVKISDLYLPESGDEIEMDIVEYIQEKTGRIRYKVNFNGLGSFKFNLQERLKNFGVSGQQSSPYFNENYEYNPLNTEAKGLSEKLTLLEECRPQLTDLRYQIMKANLIYDNSGGLIGMVDYYFRRKPAEMDFDSRIKAKRKFKSEYERYFLKRIDHGIPEAALVRSIRYVDYVIQKAALCDFVVLGLNRNKLYDFLKESYNGEIKDLIIATYFLRRELTGNIDITKIDDAIRSVKTDYCQRRLLELKTLGFASKQSYNFSLPSSNGKIIRMSDLKGKVVLIDFWFTGCGMCSSYYQKHLSVAEEYFSNNKDVVFVTVNIDSDKQKWLNSIASGKYTSTSAINLSTIGGNSEIMKYYNITGFPSILLFDKKSNLVSYNGRELLNSESLIKVISALSEK